SDCFRESSVVETARCSVFRIASTTLAPTFRYVRHASDDGPNLPRSSGSSAHRCGIECDRNITSLARAAGGRRDHAEDRVAGKGSAEIESDSPPRQEARP